MTAQVIPLVPRRMKERFLRFMTLEYEGEAREDAKRSYASIADALLENGHEFDWLNASIESKRRQLRRMLAELDHV